MSLTMNMIGGGNGIPGNRAVLVARIPSGSTVTATKGGIVLTPMMWVSETYPDQDIALFVFAPAQFDSVNPWTITATDGTNTASGTILITTNREYEIEVGYYSSLKAEILESGILLISDKVGDSFHRVYSGDSSRAFTRSSDEKILLVNGSQSSYWGYGAISFSSSLAGTPTKNGELTQYGAFTTPNGTTYYTFFQRNGFTANLGSVYYTLDGVDYSTLQMSTDYPYINTSGVLSCTDSSKLDQVYAYIDELHEYI